MLALLLCCAGAALAAPVLGDISVYGSLGETAPGLGAGFGVALPVGRVRIEPGFEGGVLMDQQVDAHLRAMVRVPLVEWDLRYVPSLRLGPGVRWTEGELLPIVMAGAGLDFRGAFGIRPRVGLDALYRWKGPVTGRLTLGLVVGSPPRPPAPVEEPPPTMDDPTGRALVWVPHPVCQWVPAREVDAWLSMVPPDQPIRVEAPGYLPVDQRADAIAEVVFTPAPEIGSLVVVAWPGDRVRYAGEEREAPGDGVVVLQLPVGLTRVEVVGHGRSAWLDVAAADGYASWMRAPDPSEHRIAFGAGSSRLDVAGADRVAAIAGTLGGGHLALQGSHSSEGTAAINDRLARERADVVRDALVALGVAPEQIEVLPPAEPDVSLDPRLQRSVVVRPVRRLRDGEEAP